MPNEDLLDLVIVGASAAGCSAGVYAARRHLNFCIVSKDIGGEVALSGDVENWPSVIHTTGVELAKAFHDHVKSYDATIHEGFGVTAIEQDGPIHTVHTEDSVGKKKVFRTKSVILATGIHPRELGVPGEQTFRGKGVTYCTVCDGPLFKNKVTATVGAGNSALESALMMADIASKVYVLTKYADTPQTKGGFPKGEDILVNKLKALDNVEIIYEAMTKEIQGDGLVSGLMYDDANGDEQTLEVAGVMVHIGAIPNSSFVDCVKKTKTGDIEIDMLGQTSCKGIFAAGDVTNLPYNQIAIAAGQGVTAALSAIDYINKWKA